MLFGLVSKGAWLGLFKAPAEQGAATVSLAKAVFTPEQATGARMSFKQAMRAYGRTEEDVAAMESQIIVHFYLYLAISAVLGVAMTSVWGNWGACAGVGGGMVLVLAYCVRLAYWQAQVRTRCLLSVREWLGMGQLWPR